MIQRLSDFSGAERQSFIEQIKEIFFEASSVKTFKNEEHRESFFFRWCGVYLGEEFPSPLIALNEKRLVGYLLYSFKSPLKEEWAQPGVECFRELYTEFPTHLHMNCHHRARGQGIGRALVENLCDILKKQHVPGVHIITSPDQENVRFYRKLDFKFEEERDFKGYTLLFMGKNLEARGRERA